MTFLQPLMLMALPVAALPVIIHLIHLLRRKQVKWAAMIFLRAAQRMHKGLSRLRQILILALRVLAVAAIILVVGRPLAGGWLGLTGGAPDTVLVLLDRSASMEQKDLATGVSKRLAGLRNLAKAIDDTTRGHSRVVLIDSALGKPLALDRADALLDVPQTEATDTASDIPALMQAALDYITTNKTGRTDVWLLSDMQQSDWAPSDGRWQSLRSAFALLQGVRFHLLTYPEPAEGDLAVTVDHVTRRQTDDKAELLLDLRVTRRLKAGAERPRPVDVPLRFEVNGVSTTAKVTIDGAQATLQGYSIPIDTSTKRGWGRVELPADACPQDNVFYFAFDEPPPLHSVIVSDDLAEAGPLTAALSAAVDPERKYTVTALGSSHAAEIPWADTALIIWQAPLPKADSAIARQLQQHVAAGRSILFMPPQTPDGAELFGMHWENWKTASAAKPASVEWWRNDSDLLANTRDGAALPVGTMEITRYCPVGGDGVPLARLAENGGLLLERSAGDRTGGGVYFLGTLPDSGSSSLARDGVVMFAMLHRALDEGAATLGKAQQGYAAATALGADPSLWKPVEQGTPATELPLHAGVVASGDRLIALNRPPGEDVAQVVSGAGINDLFSGLDYRVLTGTLEDKRSLTNEVWRTFLICMALAILGEALLCMPPRKTPAPMPPQWAGKEVA